MQNSRRLNLLFIAVFVAGAITSSASPLIDVAFTGGAITRKMGNAATGETSNDFWNTYVVNSGTLPYLNQK